MDSGPAADGNPVIVVFVHETLELPDAPFTVADADACGLPRHRLRQLLRSRLVRRVLTGVYQDAALPDTLLNRAKAAALVVSQFAVLCDRTAAWLHGVDTFEYRELDILPPLETFVLRDHSRIRRAGTLGGERDLACNDVMVIHGVKVTTPVRTALDLGCGLTRREALAALDGFLRLHALSPADLRAELPRYYRRRGVIQLRELVQLADYRAESPGESWTRLCLIDAGLPAPELQWSIVQDGREIFRLDHAYPRARVAIEFDGEEFHDSPEQKARDEARRRWLRDHGWVVIVVTKASFGREAVAAWTGEVRRALHR